VQQSHLQEVEAAVVAVIETPSRRSRNTAVPGSASSQPRRPRRRGSPRTSSRRRRKSRPQILRAPVDGTVQQLAVHTVGGVTPAQALLGVVPLNSRLEIGLDRPQRAFFRCRQQGRLQVVTTAPASRKAASSSMLRMFRSAAIR
jgi:hypothetical protein